MVVHEGCALLLKDKAESYFFMGLIELELLLECHYISRKVTMQNVLGPLFLR